MLHGQVAGDEAVVVDELVVVVLLVQVEPHLVEVDAKGAQLARVQRVHIGGRLGPVDKAGRGYLHARLAQVLAHKGHYLLGVALVETIERVEDLVERSLGRAVHDVLRVDVYVDELEHAQVLLVQVELLGLVDGATQLFEHRLAHERELDVAVLVTDDVRHLEYQLVVVMVVLGLLVMLLLLMLHGIVQNWRQQ